MTSTTLLLVVLLAVIGIGVVVYLATSRAPGASTTPSSGSSSNAADAVAAVGSGLTGAVTGIVRAADHSGTAAA